MSDHRAALQEIADICGRSRTYQRRVQHIHDVAMRALGMTKNQRIAEHERVLERIGGEPLKKAYIERLEKRNAQLVEKYGESADIEDRSF